MKIEKIHVKHSMTDVAGKAQGLEACLINFAFTDRVRHEFIQTLHRIHPAVPVFMATSYHAEPEAVSAEVEVSLEADCCKVEDVFDQACTEDQLARLLQHLRRENYSRWRRQAVASAGRKLEKLPEEWFELFECIPRQKHLPVLYVLLAKPRESMNSEQYSQWVLENIEAILNDDAPRDLE